MGTPARAMPTRPTCIVGVVVCPEALTAILDPLGIEMGMGSSIPPLAPRCPPPNYANSATVT